MKEILFEIWTEKGNSKHEKKLFKELEDLGYTLVRKSNWKVSVI